MNVFFHHVDHQNIPFLVPLQILDHLHWVLDGIWEEEGFGVVSPSADSPEGYVAGAIPHGDDWRDLPVPFVEFGVESTAADRCAVTHEDVLCSEVFGSWKVDRQVYATVV